jgi:phosphohistidine phosphatase SixA
MKFLLGLRPAACFALTVTAFVVTPFPSVAQPANRAGQLPILILIRHADTAPQPDRPLSTAGLKRAQDLAAALRNAGVTSIITTQLRRTRETAQPLATALGLVPQVVNVGERALLNISNPAGDAPIPPEVVKERAEYIKVLEPAVRRLSGVVLVVGHDWSVPGLIGSLGGPQLPNICPSVHDKLFVLISAQGKASLIQAHYGEPSPDECK